MNDQAKPGDTIRIVKMVDPIHTNESGKEYIVEHIDEYQIIKKA